jgi:pSer/pThr/pTyr-binding forkhead associated (FHA) protein
MSDDNHDFKDNNQPDARAGTDNSAPPRSSGGTTHDLRGEAEEALRRYNLDPIPRRSTPEAAPSGDGVTLRVEIKGATTALFISLTGDAIVGRRDPLSERVPDVDLTPYGGYQMGISRRHAMICLRDQGVELIDLGSRNGTFLNGDRLQGHQPAQVQNGDEVRLGKIAMVVYLETAS